MKELIIAVDFDGTCVTHRYPKVGRDIGAVPILKALVRRGHKLILYTMRSYRTGVSVVTGKEESGGLKDAEEWFKSNDIPLFGVQTNPTQAAWTSSPKCYAHLYIDDAALGAPLVYEADERPYINWNEVERLLKRQNIL